MTIPNLFHLLTKACATIDAAFVQVAVGLREYRATRRWRRHMLRSLNRRRKC